MDPNKQNPQGEDNPIQQLGKDLQSLEQQQVETTPSVTSEIKPDQAVSQVPEVPLVVPEIQPSQISQQMSEEPPVNAPSPNPSDVPVQAPTPTREIPKKGSPILTIAIILAVVALLALVAYVLGAKLLATKPTPTPTPISEVLPTPTPDVTANWKTYNNDDLAFKYPSDWIQNGYSISSTPPSVRITIIRKDSTLMNECMQETSSTVLGDLFIKKFTSVSTGQMCGTHDPMAREIWIMPSATKYAPGISYQYSSTDSAQLEPIFDQIVTTFSFISATSASSPTVNPAASPSSTPVVTP